MGDKGDVLQDLRLDNLLLINVTNLQNVLTQITAAVRQNAADIQAIQEAIAAVQDNHSSKKSADLTVHQSLKQEIAQIKEQYKNLVTGNDVNELKFAMEQKHRLLEDGLGKAKDDIVDLKEETTSLRKEVISHGTTITANKRELDVLKNDYNSTTNGLDYKLENLDHKFSTIMNHMTTFVTKDELKTKLKDDVQSLKKDIEETQKSTGETTNKLNKKLNDFLEVEYAEMKQIVPELKGTMDEMMRSTANYSVDIKSLKAFLDGHAKTLKEMQESLETKADKGALEDVAKYAVNTRSQQQQTHQLLQSSISSQKIQLREALLHNNSIEPSEDTAPTTLKKDTQPSQPTLQTQQSSTTQRPLTPQQQTQSNLKPATPQTQQTKPLTFGVVHPPQDSYSGGVPPEPEIQNTNFSVVLVPQEYGESRTEGDNFMSIVADTVDTPAPELLAKDLKETQRQCVDLRKDLSDLASLVEVLTSELKKMKEKDPNADVWQALDIHTQQLAHLLHTKADLSNVDHALSAREKPVSPYGVNAEELENLKLAVSGKVNRDELRKMRRALQKELEKALRSTIGSDAPEGGSAVVRSHYKCLACDRLIWKIDITKTGSTAQPVGTAFVPSHGHDMAPNIAWRRSQVKDIVSKHPPTTVNSLVSQITSPSTPSAVLHPSSVPVKSPKPPRTPTGPPLPPISPTASRTPPRERGERDKADGGVRTSLELGSTGSVSGEDSTAQ